jgi:hypothetical protein
MTPEQLSVAIADIVDDHLTLSMAPMRADLKALQVQIAGLETRWNDVGALRERLAVMESKYAAPPQILEHFQRGAAEPVDLSPVLERVSACEARLNAVGDLRDRVTTVETKSAFPLPPMPDVTDRIAAIDARFAPLTERLMALDHRLDMKAAEFAPALSALTDLTKDVGALRERVAVSEVRAPVPGPPGKDGVDGLGWDDLSVKHDGERTFTVQLIKGERVKDAGSFTIPVQIYRGIYSEGRTYEPGDTVTYARSLWHCIKTTVLRPDAAALDSATGKPMGGQGKDFWKLAVKAGQDGINGKDAPGALPVVAVGRR